MFILELSSHLREDAQGKRDDLDAFQYGHAAESAGSSISSEGHCMIPQNGRGMRTFKWKAAAWSHRAASVRGDDRLNFKRISHLSSSLSCLDHYMFQSSAL
ncbi:hypothetical protein PAMP_013520 [Pampus punctatissimus]